jgi:arsenate reductase (glutaredoxin)
VLRPKTFSRDNTNIKGAKNHMNIQIFGARKCFDTQKAERYFKERKVKYQSIDLYKYGMSKGEFDSVKAAVGLNNLINIDVREYKTLNLQFIHTPSMREEILFKNPKLYKTPIVRNGKKATVGYQPEVWKDWE